MKPRSNQEIYDYIFRQKANYDESTKSTPEKYKQQKKDAKIKQIKDFFFDEKSPLIPSYRKDAFRALLREMKNHYLEVALFDNDTDEIKTEKSTSIPDLEVEFKKFEKKHQFFSEDEYKSALVTFKNIFQYTKLIGDMVENNNYKDNEIALIHAYKLTVMFGETSDPANCLESFDQYLKTHNLSDTSNPIHNSLTRDLPSSDSSLRLNLSAWRKIIQQSGPKAIRLFERAFEIEENNKNVAPKDFTEAQKIAQTIDYPRASEYPLFAEICMQYNVKNKIFNECLDLKSTWKDKDVLPNVHIIDAKFPAYHLVKLPIGDPHAFILGHITNCCQSIGGNSEQCVLDGIKLENNGFYVLLKDNRKTKTAMNNPFNLDGTINYKDFDIVGQSYAWKSRRGNLVFDSWENLRPESEDKIIYPLLQKLGEVVTTEEKSTILTVTIGSGGKTPKEFNQRHILPEEMLEGTLYGDAGNQQIVYINRDRQNKIASTINQKITEIIGETKNIPKNIHWIRPSIVLSHDFESNCLKLLNNPVFQKFLKNENNVLKFYDVLRWEFIQKQLGSTHHHSIWDLSERTDLQENNILDSFFYQYDYNYFLESVHSGISTGNIEILKAILEFCDDNIKKDMIHSAIETSHLQNEILQLFIDEGLSLSEQNSKKETLLHRAIADNNKIMVNLLLKNSVPINHKNDDGNSPLHLAAQEGHEEILEILIEAKADINSVNQNGATPLHFAKTSKTVQSLLAAHADINKRDNNGSFPIHYTSRHRDSKNKGAIEALVEAKADVNVTNFAGYTPLHEADQPDITKFLIKAKAIIDKLSNQGTSALQLAAMPTYGNFEIYLALIEAKADVTLRDQFNKTLLHDAASHMTLWNNWVSPLIEAKVDVNALDDRNESPLHIAARNISLDATKLLLKAKADPEIKNDLNQTAFDIAYERKNIEICSLLKSHEFKEYHADWFKKQLNKILDFKADYPDEKFRAIIKNVLNSNKEINSDNLFSIIYHLNDKLNTTNKYLQSNPLFFSRNRYDQHAGTLLYALLWKFNNEINSFPITRIFLPYQIENKLDQFFDPVASTPVQKPE